MAVKTPIVEIPVDDEAFKKFVELWERYQTQLKASPAAWAAQGKAIDGLAEGFSAMTAALMAQAEIHHDNIAAIEKEAKAEKNAADAAKKANKEKLEAQKKYDALLAHTNKTVKDIRVNTLGAAKGIAEAAGSLIKFAGITGVFSGLIGAGGLFGLDALASGAGNSRQQAQGLGTSYGNQKAFGISYSRLVNPESFLGNVENIAASPNLQYGVGARIAQMHARGMDTADIGSALIPIIKQTFEQYGKTTQGMHASGLDNLLSLQEAMTIAANSDKDLGEFRGQYQQNRTSLSIADPTLKAWQDFDKQLDLAGDKIDKALITGLEPLAPKLSELSNAASDVISSFLARPDLKEWIDGAANGLEDFAKYIGTDKFKKDVDYFVHGVGEMASAAVEGARFLGLISRPAPDPTTADNRTIEQWNIRNPDQQIPYHDEPGDPDPTKNDIFSRKFWSGGYSGSSPLHNPLNLRPASGGGFRQFGSDDEGLRAAYNQIERDIKVHGQSTVRDLIAGNGNWPGWAPKGDGANNPDAYLANIQARSGLGPDTVLDPNNKDQLSRLIAAMAKQENARSTLTPQTVVTVLNNTGGSAIVSTAQTAAQ